MKSIKLLSAKLLLAVFLISLFSISGCKSPADGLEGVLPEYGEFESFLDFKQRLTMIANEKNDVLREEAMQRFWDSLQSNNQIPFVFNDSVAFMYKGVANDVSWAGDFNGWNPTAWNGDLIGLSDVFFYSTKLPSDARLDYKIIVNGTWKLDPSNEYIQYSGWGAKLRIAHAGLEQGS